MPRSIGCVVVSYTGGTAPQSAIPPSYLSISSASVSAALIGGICAVRHWLAGLPYFAVASALCRRHQYRVPPSLRFPTETISHRVDCASDAGSDGSLAGNRAAWRCEGLPARAFRPRTEFDLVIRTPLPGNAQAIGTAIHSTNSQTP